MLESLLLNPFIASLLIVAVCVALYWRTIFYSIVVDDTKHYKDIQGGMFDVHRRNWLKFWPIRLYGGGTFPYHATCQTCKGEKTISQDVVTTRGTVSDTEECPSCKGKGWAITIDTRWDHAFTLALFTATCVLIYLVLGRNIISFTAAILYACNPVNNQTSIWLNGRRYSVNILLTLLMLLSVPLSFYFYFLTPFMQVSAIFAPVLLGGWYMLAIPVVLAIGWKRIVASYNERMKSIVNDDMRAFHVRRLIVVVKTYGFYIGKMLWPGRTLMVYPFIYDWGMTTEGNRKAYKADVYFGIGIVALIGSAVGLALLEGQNKLYLAFLVLSTLQFCNLITPTQTAADRYVSMPNVFMMYFVAYFSHTYLGSGAWAVIAMLIAYYVQNLNITMLMYRDLLSFYDYHEYFDPVNVVTKKFRINWMLKSNDVIGAWELIRKGLVLNPTDFTMNYQAGVCLHMMGDAKMSNHYLDIANQNHYLNQEASWKKNIDGIKGKNDQMMKKRVAVQPNEWKGKR